MKNTNTTIKTYADAIAAGYTNGRESWERSYVSRKVDINTQPILRNDKTGELYILKPSWQSTTYCVRQYLIKPR